MTDDPAKTPPHALPKEPAAHDRAQPLPWEAPKSVADDPEAAARVRAILESPGFRQADRDVDFLQRDELRPTRLELDYLKTELGLREHGIQHTIVVFGSTRIPEPGAAQRRVEEAERRLERNPQDPALLRALRSAKRVKEKSRYYEVAREFAAEVCLCADGNADGVAIMTGGGPGLMEAANRGAFNSGAKSVGLNITLPHEQYPNPYLTPGLCFAFHYFALRKLHFLHRARALVAFPGGYGTFDELFETLTLVQTRKIEPLPIILVGREFWSRAVNFPFLVEEGVIDPEDEDLFWYAETADEIRSHIVEWHRFKGKPLFG